MLELAKLYTKILFSFQVLGAEFAILDEIDSGLDVDALQDVAKAVNGVLTSENSVLMITHYLRLLEFIKPTYIHIMVRNPYLQPPNPRERVCVCVQGNFLLVLWLEFVWCHAFVL